MRSFDAVADALMNPDTPILPVLEEWLIHYQSTGGDQEEDREEEKMYLAELITFIWRVSPMTPVWKELVTGHKTD